MHAKTYEYRQKKQMYTDFILGLESYIKELHRSLVRETNIQKIKEINIDLEESKRELETYRNKLHNFEVTYNER